MRLLIGQRDLADAARHILPVLDRSDPARQAVTLDGGETITADELAALYGTIGYEIICGISKRVPRDVIGA